MDLNTFSNDGSFMDNFRKMQEQQQKKPESIVTTSSTGTATPRPSPAHIPLMSKKPLTIKMSGVKKKAPILLKPTRATALKGDSSDSEEETQEGTTKECGIPLASSIGLAPHGINPGPKDKEVSGTPTSQLDGKKRKRSRWSDDPVSTASSGPVSTANSGPVSADAAAIAVAMASFSESPGPVGLRGGSLDTGGQQLTPAQLEQVKEQIEMNKMVTEIRAAMTRSLKKKQKSAGHPVFDYDSDEETEGGTWEHQKRAQEMVSTFEKSSELTEMAKGKHHIGDFLPPRELEKFLEKVEAIKEGRDPDFSDYKEHKLTESNVGFRMLQKAGWAEGEGLGEKQEGITAPINQGKSSFDQAGVGAEMPGEITKEDDPFDTYRKRMMLAYRFRPNPLNNPRRPYY